MRLAIIFATIMACADLTVNAAENPAGTGLIDFYGYTDCPMLSNERTRVILCPQTGGKVLEYSLDGRNAIGLTTDPGKTLRELTGGRFDIGPEQTLPKRPLIWTGEWAWEFTGPRAARMTSQIDPNVGFRVVRDFQLDADTSRLVVKQTVENVTNEPRECCHWSRTFAPTGGTVVVPLTSPSSLPNKYVMYEARGILNYRPEDPQIRIADDLMQITGITKFPKIGVDSFAGWLAYLTSNNLMFVKQYPVDRNRVYPDLMGITLAIFYPDNYFVELEPVGPRMDLAPGGKDSFTETWTLLDFPFPGAGQPADAGQVRKAVDALERPRRNESCIFLIPLGQENRERLGELDEKLYSAFLESEEVEYDGYSIDSDGSCVELYFYGSNAEKSYQDVRRILISYSMAKGAKATIRSISNEESLIVKQFSVFDE